VSELSSNPLLNTLRWLAQHAGYPRSRMSVQAEKLLLLATAAQIEEANEAARPNFQVKSRDVAMESAQRQHAERRRRVHFKCDNSAKV
jgi:hypothetical protein